MSYSYLPYQIDAAQEMLPILQKYKLVYLAMKQRVGKTSTAVYLAELYGAKNVAYLTIKGGPKSVVLKDAKRQFKDMFPAFDYTITTHGKAKNLKEEFDLFIIDEADKLGGHPPTPQVTLSLKQVCKGKPIIFLSATPFGDMSLSSLFNQFAVSSFSPWRGFRTWGKDKTGFYGWARQYVDMVEVNGKMQFYKKRVSKSVEVNDYSRCSKKKHFPKIKKYFKFLTHEEAGFYVTEIMPIEVTLSAPPLVERLYRDIRMKKICEVQDFVATCSNAGDEMMKLHQLASGTLKFDEGQDVILSHYKAL